MTANLDVLLTHLGTGRWSILHFFAMAYTAIMTGPNTMGAAFLAPRLDYSCRVPSPTSTSTSISSLFVSSSSFSSSSTSSIPTLVQQENNNNNDNNNTLVSSECQYTIHSPDGVRIERCVDFDFDNSTFSTTFTSEFELACDRQYLQTSFQSMYMFGIFVGAPINGYLSDKYGRKPMVVVGMIAYMVLGVASAWFPLLSIILLARFIMGFFHAVINGTSYILIVEVIEPKYRVVCGFTSSIAWALSLVLYGVMGYLIRDWRILQTVVNLFGLIVLPALWFIDESPRWLIVNGRIDEAIRVIRKAAYWQGVELPSEVELRRTMLEIDQIERQDTSSLWERVKHFVDEVIVLFRTPRLRSITLCILFDFLVVGMVYFGLSLSGGSLSNDPFIYMILSGIVEIPAYTFTPPIVQRCGRKGPLALFYLTSAVVILSLAFVPSAHSSTVMTLAMIGKLAITAGFQTIIFFASELLPTEVRSRGVGAAYMSSRLGAIASPFITDIVGTVYAWAPFVVFGVAGFLGAGVTLLLPETRGKTLPETVAHLEESFRERKAQKEALKEEQKL